MNDKPNKKIWRLFLSDQKTSYLGKKFYESIGPAKAMITKIYKNDLRDKVFFRKYHGVTFGIKDNMELVEFELVEVRRYKGVDVINKKLLTEMWAEADPAILAIKKME